MLCSFSSIENLDLAIVTNDGILLLDDFYLVLDQFEEQ
ncbi:Hypothetical protein Eab7_2128 [Exiguobacterium antarcticum B7]|nr:Hypothetical protein Eab7_2128 [Exiguobacterium antarcticum B7]